MMKKSMPMPMPIQGISFAPRSRQFVQAFGILTQSPMRWKQTGTAVLLTIVACTLFGCGGGLVAPEGPQPNAFINQVQSNCGRLSIGAQPIDYLLGDESNDAYFLDQLSKLSAGQINQATFTNNINSFYPAGANDRALSCIFDQRKGS